MDIAALGFKSRIFVVCESGGMNCLNFRITSSPLLPPRCPSLRPYHSSYFKLSPPTTSSLHFSLYHAFPDQSPILSTTSIPPFSLLHLYPLTPTPLSMTTSAPLSYPTPLDLANPSYCEVFVTGYCVKVLAGYDDVTGSKTSY